MTKETDYKLKYKALKYWVKLAAAQKKKLNNGGSGLPPCKDNRICVEGDYGQFTCYNQGWFGANVECDDGDSQDD